MDLLILQKLKPEDYKRHMKIFALKAAFFIISALFLLYEPSFALASSTNGTIDGTNRYAWSENSGWLDFGDADGDIHITDSALTGYIWMENAGWASLNCSNGPNTCGAVNFKVANDGEGALSGYAWGENSGWIDFAPTGGGVAISSSGVFSGYAWSENLGWINFTTANPVTTDWRPLSVRNVANAASPVSVVTANGPIFQGQFTQSGRIEFLTQNPASSSANNAVAQTAHQDKIAEQLPEAVNADGNISNNKNNQNEEVSSGIDAEPPLRDVPLITSPVAIKTLSLAQGLSDQIAESNFLMKKIFSETLESLRKAFEKTSGSAAAKTIIIFGILVGGVLSFRQLFASPLTIPELVFIPTRLWGAFSVAVGLRKRLVPWGTVYDSFTKQPIDPAVVRVKDLNGKIIKEAITDIDGRYGFLLPPGIYQMIVAKTHYVFPSLKLNGRHTDEIYDELYFGGKITISENAPIIKRDIPLDALSFDWNEFQKNKQNLIKHSRRELILLKLSDLIFSIGLILALLAIISYASFYNILIILTYAFILITRFFGRDPKSFGMITYRKSGNPASFSILRVSAADNFMHISQKVADAYGRYFCLVPRGEYSLTIDKKLPDGSYEKALERSVKAPLGIIDKDFQI
ncbi:MAG TPA: carboxypeptidase-like regulatory domain-containing protein [Candidatus Paceibacterota bacterium]